MTLVQGHILTSVSSLKIQQTISDLMRRQTSRVKGQHHVEYLILLSFVSLWMLVQLLVVDMCVCTLDCLLCTMDVYIVYSQRVAGDTFTLVYRNSNGFRKRPQFNKYIVSLPLCNAFCRKTQLHELKIWVTGQLSGRESAYPRTKKSVVQASTTVSCCEGELYTYIQLLLLILASCY